MKKSEIEQYKEEIDGVLYTPQFTYDSYDVETEEYSGFKIVKTAREVCELLHKEIKPTLTTNEQIKALQGENKALKSEVSTLNDAVLELTMTLAIM